MSDNPEFHQCGTCGFEWKHGVHGGHSCTDTLSTRLASQQAAHDAEIAKLAEQIAYLGDWRDKAIQASLVSHEQFSTANDRIACLEGLVALQVDALKFTREELRACQAAIHISGDFDPLYVIVAQKAMKQADAAISASAETVQAFRDKLIEPLLAEIERLEQSKTCHPAACRDEELWRKTLAEATEPFRREVAQAREMLDVLYSQVIREGWQLVPIDATEMMLLAADDVCWSDEDVRGSFHNMWHMMLAAAPQPKEQQK